MAIFATAMLGLFVIALAALGAEGKKQKLALVEIADLKLKVTATEEVARQYAAAYTETKAALTLALAAPTGVATKSWH
jgi:hypothetical protein